MSTDTKIKLSESAQKLLRCPICKSNLVLANCQIKCINITCEALFPVVDGIPILISEASSLFSIDEFVNCKNTFFRPSSRIERSIISLLPEIDCNVKAKTNYEMFADLLLRENENPRVLVIGGSIIGRGMHRILSVPSIEYIESDVSFGPRTALICDAHDIPFDSSSLDGVIIQAVLEHVVDPYHCVEEIYRVLKKDGLVYAETPFMQQVHGGKYDFTRFTHLGHRFLFREFEEISSGVVAGPAMALAWAYRYFLLSFVKSKAARAFVGAFVRLTSFWLKYIDYYLLNNPGALDAASQYYFMGRKSDLVPSDRELIDG